jgi:hypothetical protein
MFYHVPLNCGKEEGYKDAEYFTDADFVIKVAYLSDIFEKPNSLNVSLQGKNMHLLKSTGKNISFYKKKTQTMEKKM